jgi:hypothetical protein
MGKLFVCFLITSAFSTIVWGASTQDQWIPMDPTKRPQESLAPAKFSPPDTDSLNLDTSPVQPQHSSYFWTLDPKLGLGLGALVNSDRLNEPVISWMTAHVDINLLVSPTYRYNLQLLVLPSDSVFLSASWETTPSRKALRPFYGFGLAHQMIAHKEFSNLVEWDQYFLTLQAGIEYQLPSQNGVRAELKSFINRQDPSLLLNFSYLFNL